MVIREDYLAHHGVKGQQHGVRRYQNEDGSLTPEGRIHYGYKSEYSELSNQELQTKLNNYRNRSDYIGFSTKKYDTKKTQISNLAKNIGGATASITKAQNLYNKPKLEAKRTYEKNEDGTDKLTKDGKRIPAQDENNAAIDAKEATLKANEDKGKKLSEVTNTYGNDIGSALTSRGRKAAAREASERASELSDEELKKVVERMKLEEQLDAYEHPPKKTWLEKAATVAQYAMLAANVAITLKTVKDMFGKPKVVAVPTNNQNQTQTPAPAPNPQPNKKDKNNTATHSAILMHYGVKGMSKGHRRYQNPDGSLTPEGYRHYGIDPNGRNPSGDLAKIQRHEFERARSISEQRQNQKLQREQLRNMYRDQRISMRSEAKLRKAEDKTDARLIAKQNKRDAKFADKERKREVKLANQDFKREFKQNEKLNKQELKFDKKQRQLALDEKRAQHDESRRNFFKLAIGATALAGVAYIGYSKIHNKNLQFKNNLELEKIAAEGSVALKKLGLEKDAETKIAAINANKDIEVRRSQDEATKYTADQNRASKQYEVDKNSATEKYKADQNSETEKYKADKRVAEEYQKTQQHMYDTQAAREKQAQETIDNERRRYAEDKKTAEEDARKREAQEAERQKAEKKAAEAKAKADKEAAEAKAKADAERAEREREERKAAYEKQRAQRKEAEERNQYDGMTKAEYDAYQKERQKAAEQHAKDQEKFEREVEQTVEQSRTIYADSTSELKKAESETNSLSKEVKKASKAYEEASKAYEEAQRKAGKASRAFAKATAKNGGANSRATSKENSRKSVANNALDAAERARDAAKSALDTAQGNLDDNQDTIRRHRFLVEFALNNLKYDRLRRK